MGNQYCFVCGHSIAVHKCVGARFSGLNGKCGVRNCICAKFEPIHSPDSSSGVSLGSDKSQEPQPEG